MAANNTAALAALKAARNSVYAVDVRAIAA